MKFRMMLVLFALLLPSVLRADPIGFKQGLDPDGLDYVIQSGDDNSIGMQFRSSWGAHVAYDGYLSYLWFPASNVRLRIVIYSKDPAAPVLHWSLGVCVTPNDPLNYDSCSWPNDFVLFPFGMGNEYQTFHPGDSFDFNSIQDDPLWHFEASFHGTIAATGEGSGDGTITITRQSVPDTTSTVSCLLMGLIGIGYLMRQHRVPT